MEMYCIEGTDYDENIIVIGYTTTEEKAKRMVEVMRETDRFDSYYEYKYRKIYVDMLIINDKKIEFWFYIRGNILIWKILLKKFMKFL